MSNGFSIALRLRAVPTIKCGMGPPIRLQKLFSRRKYVGCKSGRLQKALQRLTGGQIIVDECNERLLRHSEHPFGRPERLRRVMQSRN
jgi:hypothetical protein